MIQVSIFIIALRSVSEVTMDYTLEAYFREFWRDERLAFDRSLLNRSEINIDVRARSLIWRPDTSILNSVTSTEPRGDSLTFREHVRVHSNGLVFQTRR